MYSNFSCRMVWPSLVARVPYLAFLGSPLCPGASWQRFASVLELASFDVCSGCGWPGCSIVAEFNSSLMFEVVTVIQTCSKYLCISFLCQAWTSGCIYEVVSCSKTTRSFPSPRSCCRPLRSGLRVSRRRATQPRRVRQSLAQEGLLACLGTLRWTSFKPSLGRLDYILS